MRLLAVMDDKRVSMEIHDPFYTSSNLKPVQALWRIYNSGSSTVHALYLMATFSG